MKPITVFSALCSMILYASILMACTTRESSSPINFDKDYLNQQITMKAPDFYNTFNTTDAISIEITNNSMYEVVFPNDYNIRIFSDFDNKWIEIPETPTVRLPDGDFVLSPNNNMLTVESTFVVPDLPDLTRRYHLRIYVFGDMKVNSESVVVAAFTDVMLRP